MIVGGVRQWGEMAQEGCCMRQWLAQEMEGEAVPCNRGEQEVWCYCEKCFGGLLHVLPTLKAVGIHWTKTWPPKLFVCCDICFLTCVPLHRGMQCDIKLSHMEEARGFLEKPLGKSTYVKKLSY